MLKPTQQRSFLLPPQNQRRYATSPFAVNSSELPLLNFISRCDDECIVWLTACITFIVIICLNSLACLLVFNLDEHSQLISKADATHVNLKQSSFFFLEIAFSDFIGITPGENERHFGSVQRHRCYCHERRHLLTRLLSSLRSSQRPWTKVRLWFVIEELIALYTDWLLDWVIARLSDC